MFIRHSTIFALMTTVLWMQRPTQVRAYDPSTHSRIVSSAVAAMQRNDLTVSAPTDIYPRPSQAEFDDYLSIVRAAPMALGKLGTGLPTKVPVSNSSTGLFGPDGDASFPFQETYTYDGPPDPRTGQPTRVKHAPKCDTHQSAGPPDNMVQADDLTDVSQFRISDFRYIPDSFTGAGCGVKMVGDSSVAQAPPDVLAKILGWHAASIDFHINDSVLWLKPTNAEGAAAIKDIAREAVSDVLGTLIVPFQCISDWLQGNSCNLHKPYQISNAINPVDFIDGLLPGIGDVRSDSYTGLWHFIHVNAGSGDFNNYPGMYYPKAGPNGHGPGVLDVAIIVISDLSGLSLNAYASDGVNLYGNEDDINRLGPAPWMAYSIGHVEFSSLDNLAKAGWRRWLRDGARTAEGLAWPLHAIGDAAEPHHTVGTTSWGHRALEGAVSAADDEFLPESGTATVDMKTLDSRQTRILRASYHWWRILNDNGGDVESFIEQLALDTRGIVATYHDWAYVDLTSLQEWAGDDAGRKYFHDDWASHIQHLLDSSSAAAIGFLTYASQHANGLETPTPKCPVGTHFEIFNGCVQTSPDPTAWPANGCHEGETYCMDSSSCGSSAYTCEKHCCRLILE